MLFDDLIDLGITVQRHLLDDIQWYRLGLDAPLLYLVEEVARPCDPAGQYSMRRAAHIQFVGQCRMVAPDDRAPDTRLVVSSSVL